ncbi:aldose epimerase family protein [Rhodovibrio salinarum]|nr:aldose epimerase family protein [Rhodovibrio salinarum]
MRIRHHFSFGPLMLACGLAMAVVSGAQAAALGVNKETFGTLSDGTEVDIYTLTNANRMEVTILTYGSIVQSIRVPDRNGEIDDVSLGFDDLESYVERNPYFGALIGRFGNRIAGGTFTLDGESYELPVNNGPNSLHGGTKGFDKRVWAASPIRTGDHVGVELTYFSPNGEMGYPGNLAVTVRYTLNNDNDLRIHYSAVTDAPTVLNLTNHVYLNMAGAGNGTILDQVAMLNADRITPVDDTLIPTGDYLEVEGTPLDFTTPTPIGQNIRADHQQLKYAEPEQGGYDHNYVLNNPGDLSALAARVTDPQSGRTVEMYTTEPGVQFYTSNFLDDVQGQDGETYPHWGGFTLEAQHFPDSPNQPDFPSTVLRPGEKYTQTTIYKFLPM